MEYIDGIKISDRDKILEAGLDTKKIASTVVDLYLKQIIDYGFFHADPHSGNIFVLTSGKIVFIDYGSMGRLLPDDTKDLSDFIIYAMRKDTKRLIRIIKRISIEYNIENERQLQRDLYYFIDMLDDSSIKELDMNDITRRFGKLLNRNQTILPEYIYLLARGIVLLEGIGRELQIETNIIENITPYTTKLVRNRLDPKYISKQIVDKLYDWGDGLEELPKDSLDLIKKINNDRLLINHGIRGLNEIKTSSNRITLSILIASLTIGSSILIHAQMPPILWGISVLGFIGFFGAGALSTILIFSILKNK